MDIDEFREHSRRTWDAMAAGWEARDAFLEHNTSLVSERIIDQFQAQPGQIALDVGAGPGDLGHRIAGLVGPGGRVISTDFAQEMVTRRRARARGDRAIAGRSR